MSAFRTGCFCVQKTTITDKNEIFHLQVATFYLFWTETLPSEPDMATLCSVLIKENVESVISDSN